MHPIDGGLFDALTFAVALAILAIKSSLRMAFNWHPTSWVSASITDLFYAALVFPFGALLALPILIWLSRYFDTIAYANFLASLRLLNPGRWRSPESLAKLLGQSTRFAK